MDSISKTNEVSAEARTRAILTELHDVQKLSWRKIAGLDEFRRIPFATLNAIYHGRNVKNVEYRLILGWGISSTVVCVYGPIPDGTQAYSAQECACGQWYISNHPCRKKCFICSPYKGKKANR